MQFVEAVKAGFRLVFTYSGRAPRCDYWYFMLFVVLAVPVLGFFLGMRVGLFSVLALFLPSLAATIRRLHDIDKSEGWAYLGTVVLMVASLCLMLVPMLLLGGVEDYIYFLYAGVIGLVAVIAAMVFYLSRKGTDGENRFGDGG